MFSTILNFFRIFDGILAFFSHFVTIFLQFVSETKRILRYVFLLPWWNSYYNTLYTRSVRSVPITTRMKMIKIWILFGSQNKSQFLKIRLIRDQSEDSQHGCKLPKALGLVNLSNYTGSCNSLLIELINSDTGFLLKICLTWHALTQLNTYTDHLRHSVLFCFMNKILHWLKKYIYLFYFILLFKAGINNRE